MTENKPRELKLTIGYTTDKPTVSYIEAHNCTFTTGETIRVIEYSSLEALRAENEELKALKDKAADIAMALGVEHNQKNREIEKLQKQLEAAKAENEELKRAFDDWKDTALIQADEVVSLNKELAAAKAEIERLKEFEFMYKGLQK